MEILKALRKERQMTQDELAEKSGVSRVTIAKLESGAQNVTTNTTIIKLAHALNIDAGDLLTSNS